MYQLINRNIHPILNQITDTHVSDYEWLLNNLHRINVTENLMFQKKYRGYWVMRYISSASQFNHEYFKILETSKYQTVTFEVIARRLNNVPYDQAGNRTAFQFSFITKLLHTINFTNPVFDSMVRDFFFIPQFLGDDFENDLIIGKKIIKFLISEIQRVKTQGLLEPSIAAFKEKFDPSSLFSDEKIIDSLIWAFVKLAKNGNFITGNFTYS